MHPDAPLAPFAAEAAELTADLARLAAQAAQGPPPAPARLKGLLGRARTHAAEVAAYLGPAPDPERDPAGVAALETAARICQEAARLSQELAREHGPAFLVLPGGQ